MKRQRPPHLNPSPFVTATATPPAHPDIWLADAGPDTGTANGAAALAFVFVLVVTVPFYGVALLLITAVEAAKGLPLSYAQSLTEPMLLVPLFGTALLAAGLLRWGMSSQKVLGLTFDGPQQVLRATVRRPLRKPVEWCVPFDDILGVTPYVMASYDRHGHFQVTFKGPNGKPVEHRFGWHMPLDELEFHALWLRGFIGERMHEVLNLDL